LAEELVRRIKIWDNMTNLIVALRSAACDTFFSIDEWGGTANILIVVSYSCKKRWLQARGNGEVAAVASGAKINSQRSG
jgi:hypothetical protein